MDYNKIYKNIISNRLENEYDGYTERHHIIPRCLGGTDNKDNLVNLSAREHFICHLLLTKMYPRDSMEYYKMCNAFFIMKYTREGKHNNINSKLYDRLKNDFSIRMSELQSGEGNSQSKTYWCYNLTTYENIKLKNNIPLPDGYTYGRFIKGIEKEYNCNICNEKIIVYKKNDIRKRCEKCRYIIWIYNPTLKISKSIGKDSIIEDGWFKGRILDWDLYERKILTKSKKELVKKQKLYTKSIRKNKPKINKPKINKHIEKRNILESIDWDFIYIIYKMYGFEITKNLINYNYTREALLMQFKKRVSSDLYVKDLFGRKLVDTYIKS